MPLPWVVALAGGAVLGFVIWYLAGVYMLGCLLSFWPCYG
jgi:hypothetical protein